MKKWYERIPYFIFGLGIIMDIGVNVTGIYKIHVTESYMDYIFAGIITISVLCFSFVALISGFLEKVYLGYKLRDIIQLPHSPVNTKRYISVSLCTIVIGVCLLAGDFVVSCANSLTALLLALIWIEGNVAFKVYDLITNENAVCNLVIAHFSAYIKEKHMDFEEFHAHTDKIISALTTCISKNDSSGKDRVCAMLAELGVQIQIREGEDDYYSFYNYFNDKMRECVDSFAMVFGFNEMLNFVIKVYARLSDFEYGRIDLYVIPLKNMRFWTDQLLLEKNYFKQIAEVDLLEIYKNKKITNTEIEDIFYQYFDNIMRNCICTNYIREQLVESYTKDMMKLCWKTNEVGVAPDVDNLLNITKYYILKNNNVEERNYVFRLFIMQAFYNNSYDKEKYFDFLALFFQAFYAYIFCEVETLNEKYREGLMETFKLEFASETISKMSAAFLVRINIKGILIAIGRRITQEDDSQERRFENYPSFIMAKSAVWTSEFNITFLFMLYLIFYDEVGFYSIYKGFLDWDTISQQTKIFILEQLQSQFDLSTGLLQKSFINTYTEYGVLLNHTSNITEQIQQKMFEHILEEHTEIKTEKIDNLEPVCLEMDCDEVMVKINELMEKERIFGWRPEYFTDSYVKFVIPDCICRKEYRNIQSTARTIQRGIIQAIQRYVQQNSGKLSLSFNLEGVQKMLDFLKKSNYNARNYTFTDDLALSKFKKETNFIRLEEEQEKIEFVNTPQVFDNLYFMKENFVFNIKISKLQFFDLSERECAEFLEHSKCYNGLYNVDGALMAKEEAMRCVKKIYCKERYSFKLMVGLGKNDVTYIEFEH